MKLPVTQLEALAVGLLLTVSGVAAPRPNIVWITAEDLGPHLGAYGDELARTPALDRLAAEGVRYTNAFAHAGVCAPARSGLITGMYPSSLGSHHMRSRATLPESLKTLPELLRAAGYYTGNVSKTDYNFETPAGAWSGVGKRAHWSHRADGQPFFYVVNLFVTHESRVRLPRDEFRSQTPHVLPDDRRDPSDMRPPPYHPDTPAVRAEWARYYEMIAEMDAQAGAVLEELEEDGLADSTVVFFFSDHGTGLPRAKQFIFDAGLKTPLIVRFPRNHRDLAVAGAGETIGRLVSFVDFAPTVLSLVGESIPDRMQGKAFAGRWSAEPRSYVYAMRDRMDERYDMSRAVRDEHFKYHRNFFPYLPHFPWLDYMDQLETSKEMRRLAAAGELKAGVAHFMAPAKPLDELYDIRADPHELRNLAENPAYAAQLRRMRRELVRWMSETRDLGFVPEQILRDAASEYDSEYAFGESASYPLDRVLDTAFQMDEGVSALPILIERLSDPNPTVRFWAATGATALAPFLAQADSLPDALEGIVTEDREAEVRLAAVEALCALGRCGNGLPVLARFLRDRRWPVRVRAANVIDRIDEQARPLLPEIRQALANPLPAPRYAETYVPWLLKRALRELR